MSPRTSTTRARPPISSVGSDVDDAAAARRRFATPVLTARFAFLARVASFFLAGVRFALGFCVRCTAGGAGGGVTGF